MGGVGLWDVGAVRGRGRVGDMWHRAGMRGREARAWAFGCGGCSVLFGPRSASGGAAQHRWRFGHDLAISVMT